ncbi:hypothetical protein KAM449_44490 [Aeromonas caviae]|uniref:Uncharacterized protein n=1 Tax=Aeromonas caviae TaxID=648 RepID=A0ABD0BGT7_AERCA|nr:hypothetical protein KAM362_44990 [Aeromonas caviae]GJB26745.1 hypothetical protein KAM365_44950 [Aeromonas caviae]GJB52969.1 hypothetical protein KAM372_44300 [Aeromonas caviae]GJB57433.1 hypothetical protein KAM373_44280 [Aeromonas caviae]GJB61901.1 hypothetical protein KAM374_44370 [Aeromonas caviae]
MAHFKKLMEGTESGMISKTLCERDKQTEHPWFDSKKAHVSQPTGSGKSG